MKLDKGLNRDSSPNVAEHLSWRNAGNIIISKGGISMENEKGLTDLNISFTYSPIGIINIPTGAVIFSTNNTTSEIGLFENDTYTTVIQSDYLGFNINSPIEGAYSYNDDGDLLITWCDGILSTANDPYLINLTHYTESSVNIILEAEVEKMKLFPNFTAPNFILSEISNSGGTLNSGVYYFTIKYKVNSSNYTNWSRLSLPISIIDDVVLLFDPLSTGGFKSVDGCIANTDTSKSINITIDNIDTRYASFKLGVMQKIDGVITSYEIGEYPISASTELVEYSGTESGISSIDTSEILVNKASYSKVNTMVINNNKLLIANLKTEDEIKYQKYANSIATQWNYRDTISLDSPYIINTYKDSISIFDKRGFMPGEVYALYIGFHKKTGGISQLFHIPGRVSSGTDLSNIAAGYETELVKVESDYQFKNFQILDTSSMDANTVITLDNLAASDPGGGATRFPSTGHLLTAGDEILIEGTVNYDGYCIVSNVSDANHFDVVVTYAGEVFTGAETVTTYTYYGDMGYWENEHEKYPTTPDGDFITSVDYDGNILIGAVNLDNAAVTDLAGVPNEVRIPCTLHGFLEDDQIHITGTTNYDGLYTVSNVNDPNTFDIEAVYVAETFTGGGVEEAAPLVSYENTPVRHHRFPMLNKLSRSTDYNIPYFSDTAGESWETYSANFGSPITTFSPSSLPTHAILSTSGASAEIGSISNTIFTANQDFSNVTITYYINGTFSGDDVRSTVELRKNISGSTTVLDTGYEAGAFGAIVSISNSGGLNIGDMASGDTITIYGYGYSKPNYLDPLSGSFTMSVTVSVQINIVGGGNIFGRILGLNLNNIVIPDEIKDKITGYEIFYAKRDFDNSMVIAQGRKYFVAVNDTLYSHPFDLMVNGNMPSVKPNYIMHEAYSDVTPAGIIYPVLGTSVITIPTLATDTLRGISGVKYLPRDNSLTIPDNSDRETSFFGYSENTSFDSIAADTHADILGNSRIILVTFYSFKKDLYNRFYNQELVSTGKVHSIGTGNTFATTSTLYGGDTFINMHGVRYLTGANTEKYYYYPCYSVSNIGLRHEGESSLQEYYYPKHSSIDPTKVEGASYTQQNEVDSYWGYNEDYTSLSNLSSYVIKNFIDEYSTSFPHRVAISNVLQSEGNYIGWKDFLPLSYYESVKNKGEIVKLFNDGLDLCISHKYSLFVAQLKQSINISDDIIASLGDANLFDTTPLEVIFDKDGYVGNQCKFATVNTKIGTLLIDRERGKVFIYGNRKISEISVFGLIAWFESNLEYSVTGVTLDNPFNKTGYSACYDEKNSRILITKYDTNEADSYTISFSVLNNGYISFHSYLPVFMFNNRKSIYSISNKFDRLYKHEGTSYGTGYGEMTLTSVANVGGTPNIVKVTLGAHSYATGDNIYIYGTTNYNGAYTITTKDATTISIESAYVAETFNKTTEYICKVNPCYIDILFNDPIGVNKLFNSISWETSVTSGNINYYDETLTHIIIFNYNQHSSKITLTAQTFAAGNVRKTGGTWKFNSFRDILKDKEYTVIEDLDIDELYIETLGSGEQYTDWKDKGRFINEFIIVRFIYDNADQKRLLLNNIDINKTIKNR